MSTPAEPLEPAVRDPRQLRRTAFILLTVMLVSGVGVLVAYLKLAERQAAENLAAATKIEAEAEAAAAKIRAAGVIELGEAQARAERAKNEARNALSPAIIEFELNKARVDIVPAALAQAMKPIEKISDIRIFSAGNLVGAMNGGASGEQAGAVRDLSSQLLSFTAQKPILDEILKQAGFEGADPTQALLAASVGGASKAPAPPAPAAEPQP